MQKLHKLSTAVVLTLILAVSVFAGEIPIGKEPPPPPPASVTTAGEIPIGVVTKDADSTNSLFEDIVLNLLQTVLSVY